MTIRWACAVLLSGVLLAVSAGAGLAAQEAVRPRPMNHEAEGNADCFTCHFSLPEGHEGRRENVCLWCHAHDSPMLVTDPPTVGHPVEGRETCLTCHGLEGVLPMPENHEGRTDANCLMCHQQAVSDTLQAESRPVGAR